MTTNQTIDGVPRRVCHACVTLPRNAYCPVCDDEPAAHPQGNPSHWSDDLGNTITTELRDHNLTLGGAPAAAIAQYSRPLYPSMPQGEPVADALSTGFYTTESGGGKYAINIGFRSMAEMQAADQQLRDLLRSRRAELPAPVAVVAVVLPDRHEDRTDSSEAESYQNGWNACLDEVTRLNTKE